MRKIITGIAGVCTFVLVLGFAAMAAPKSPANAAGTWKMSLVAPQGNAAATLTLKQDSGGKLTGTLQIPSASGPVKGTVSGDEVDFSGSLTMPGGQTFPSHWNATISGDSMKGTANIGSHGGKWTATRQK